MNSVKTLAATSLAACAVLVVLLLLDLHVPAAIAKLVASSAFVGLAIASGALQTTYGRFLLAGLVLSWCGDMFLIGMSRTAFLSGLVAFLLAHIAYVIAFIRLGYDRSWTLAAAVPVTVVAIVVFAWLQPHIPADLDIPVRAYIAVISVMVIFAFGTRGARV